MFSDLQKDFKTCSCFQLRNAQRTFHEINMYGEYEHFITFYDLLSINRLAFYLRS